LRSYDDAQLSLPGLAVTFRPRPHQVAAVARMIHEPAVLLAHEVGAGKTAEMIMGVTELRRLGLVRKPAIVVPNHMLEQFTREWLQLYPQAKVLAVSKDQLRQDRRREFVARCATGTWDGVVITRSAFERIPLRPDAQREYMNRELERWRQWLDTARKSGGLSVKRLQGALLRAEERLKAKLDSAKDPGVTFEETGVDYLCVDEAHGYKNLRTPSNISDAAIDGSMRAADLDMKIDYLRRRNGSRVVTFATATPIANSVTEAYVMQKYLRPDLLEKAGIEVFDTWAATFGQVVAQVELAPEGGGRFRTKARFARFANVPEMLKMLHVAADVKTAEDLKLPVPLLTPRAEDGKRIPEIITVEPTDELIAYVAELGDRAGKVRQGSVASTDDNMLKISGDGRRAALDMRMVGLPQTTPGKIAAAAGQIAGIWHQHHDREYQAADGQAHPVRGALQLVFCDLGTPGPGWNVYEELRDELAGRGLPPEAVRFIHEAKTDRDKGRLFAACRNGSVAVLIGSTEKMGVGTNVQDRAIALHHLDAPWRPADVAQREGRILRQGNLNPEVRVYRYVTARSFDGYMWQTLERKARFISQVMHARLDARDITDIGDTALSFSEVKALATGNPLLIDKAEADAELTRLQRAERAHQRSQQSLRYTITRLEQGITNLTRQADDTDAAISRRQDTRGGKFTMTIGSVQHTRRADAGQHLAQAIQQEAAQLDGYRDHTIHVGQLGGFLVSAALQRSKDGKTAITITLDGAPGAGIDLKPPDLRGSDHGTLITRLEHRLARLDDRKASILADIQHAERETAHARENLGQPFPQAEQLIAARNRARQINDQLEQMAARQQADAGTAPEGRNPAPSPAAPGTSIPETARETGDSSAVGRSYLGQFADWRDQLMASSREQWMSRVPQPPGPAVTTQPPEADAPEATGLALRCGRADSPAPRPVQSMPGVTGCTLTSRCGARLPRRSAPARRRQCQTSTPQPGRRPTDVRHPHRRRRCDRARRTAAVPLRLAGIRPRQPHRIPDPVHRQSRLRT
ncbi:MAG TPA: SNF2-related protein, partial [Streptosporangiaceae bacterium]